MLYFAYGSNMSTPRLAARVPSARVLDRARLDSHRLRFHKQSIDGSAKCDIEISEQSDTVVHGVLFEIAPAEKADLDRHEGLGHGYAEKFVSVCTRQGQWLSAVTYYAIQIDPGLKPYSWYLEHVLRGAREHELPDSYIRKLAVIEAVPDPDRIRHEQELAIYR